MKVFISWSGELSGKVARIFRDWLPYVIPSIQPYVSVEDIEKGKLWGAAIASELDSSNFGILCVTQKNFSSPWLNFEAGALSKSVTLSHVCPFLFGLESCEVSGPLTQFQFVNYNKDDIERLIITLNSAMGHPIKEGRLHETFNKWWPDLDKELEKLHYFARKKIIWLYENPKSDSSFEINKATEAGFRDHKHWTVGEGNPPEQEECDVVIYVFGKTTDSTEQLKTVMHYAKSLKEGTPLIVYTRYASGDGRLSDEEFRITQEHSKSVIANMPEMLMTRIKEMTSKA